MLAWHLEFDCTNNVVEYEPLVKGLRKTLYLQFKCIKVFTDPQVVIRQVINSIHCTLNHLNNYQREVWNLMPKFEAFSIRSIPCALDSETNMLDNVASNLCPSNDFSHEKFSIELIYTPSILDTIKIGGSLRMMNKS